MSRAREGNSKHEHVVHIAYTLSRDTTIRLWKAGIRDVVMELCCTLHNFRGRLNPWLPMI
jgi:hypothetical protein